MKKENKEPIILDFRPARTCKDCQLSNNGCSHNLVENLADLQDKGLLTTEVETGIDRKYYTTTAPLNKIRYMSCKGCNDWWIQDKRTTHACKCKELAEATEHKNTNKNFVSLVLTVTAVGGAELTAQKACELIRRLLPDVDRGSVSAGAIIKDKKQEETKK